MIPLGNILFLDIETVSQYEQFEELPEKWKELWTRKADGLLRNKTDDQTPATIYERAAIYSEFGKIICISCGIIQGSGEHKSIAIKSFYGDDERKILSEFCEMLTKWTPGTPKYLCAHNGREFDFPYLCRRMVINNECIPELLTVSGKRPWEINHLDTMEMWRFGDFKNYTSLNLLSHVLNIPSSKDDIDGSMVGLVYWKEKDINRIVQYCQKDVVTLAQVYLRLNRESLIPANHIEIK